MGEKIYDLPEKYDLEHAGREPDLSFYVSLVQRWRARRILELGCGTGRVTIPIAASLRNNALIVGLDEAGAMLKAARKKAAKISKRVRWVKADLRSWRDKERFDLIIAPGGTLSHLLTMEDQMNTWKTALANLEPGGRFVVEVGVPELAVLAESLQNPRRTILEIDHDTTRPMKSKRRRLLRYKAVNYDAPEQRASVRYLYDEFVNEKSARRFLSDYEQHVYYPRELELLFRMTGFAIESVWGDYTHSAMKNSSRQMVMVGVNPA
jgi:trans-aconitate methyltransferase